MKRVFSIILFLFSVGLLNAQIGINTNDPKASLDIRAQTTDGTTAEGLIVPRLTLAQLVSKDAKYTSDQTGSLIYVTDATGTTTTKTKKVIAPGYYSFDGTMWQGMSPDQSLRFFYMPSIVLPTDINDGSYNAGTGTFTIDLYKAYSEQFGLASANASSWVKSPSATALPVLANSAFEYLITYYDNTVFQNVAVTDAGVLTYKLPTTVAVSEKTFMNIIFKLK
ncbi:hypothetical protein [Dysgonomonas macrotermitis]|uniref:Uncharacterized protein n=1 Tax=Dysgonomonas macrotermitis TaxID=1346286 RepID=A0A1M5BRZ1_9BACT|nr:hypothetical protein [Dysgonomonas macrotermitis]SHF45303.1 hypothetical protein SAMN05444362_106173 [Dysgonomonas macrotermitis]